MKTKRKVGLFIGSILLLVIAIFFLYQSTKKVVYLEYERYGELCDQLLEVCDNNTFIEQEFSIPYQMFYGISVRIGTYGRENNSTYELIITDKTTNEIVTSMEFNTTQAKDDLFYELLLDSPIKVENTHKFSAKIKAKSLVNGENGVAFYADLGKENANNGDLYYKEVLQNANLCMNVYGGNTNQFWVLITFILEAYFAVLIFYMLYLKSHKKSIKKNAFVQAGLVGIATFALLFVFCKMESFSDEIDNMIGGMLIAKGKILYVDYYSGHTPFAYFLCAIFSLLGAASQEQFRLSYYILITLIYVGLFLRHKKNFGAKKMALLPIIQILFGVAITEKSLQVLSDNIQAIAMVALLLEFLQYLKDEKLDWERVSLVSVSIFCSFGSAFVSVYGIFAIGLGVFVKEVFYWIKNGSYSLKNLFQRYWKLAIAIILPFVLAFAYLVLTHSLTEFYQQAYQFNTKIYSHYLSDGYGTNVIQPFFIGIQNLIQMIPNAVFSILQQEDNMEILHQIVRILVGLGVIVGLFKMALKKEYLKLVTIVLFISFNFTRNNEIFHTIPAWAVMLTTILLTLDFKNMTQFSKNISIFLLVISILCAVHIYSNAFIKYGFKPQKPIFDLAQKVVQETKNDEKIFLDIFSDVESSMYLIYKNRLPMNKLCFILPWYFDWYELETVQEIQDEKPRFVIYDEEAKVWEISGYDDYFLKVLHENYDYVPGNKKIWILK